VIIKSLKKSNAKGYLILGVESEGETVFYTVSEAQYSLVGSLLIGDEIDGDTLNSLDSFSEYNKAKKKALSVLSFGDNSKRELYSKLVRSGIKSDTAKGVTEEMVRLGYINEARQLERLIENEVNKRLTGPRKYTQKLAMKGYSPQEVRRITESLVSRGIIDFDETKKKLAEKFEGGELRKILYKHGF
jgi:SOS response regulatory protein OraA/RecX